jgi:hypothetical protein
MAWAWVVRNCFQVGFRPPWCRVDAGLMQDLPHGARGDLIAEPAQFTVDPAVPPS